MTSIWTRGHRPLDLPIDLGSRRGTVGSAQVKDQRKRVTVLYTGHVQGVGFRYAVSEVAEGFDVCGTVRNLPDGRVELIAEGAVNELNAFLQAIRESGLGSLIRHEALDWSPGQGDLRGFQIVR